MLSEDFREIEYMVINNKLYEMELKLIPMTYMKLNFKYAKCHLLRNRMELQIC